MRRSRSRWMMTWVIGWVVVGPSAAEEPLARHVPGWGDVVDPARDCPISFDSVRDRLLITVPGTPHLLSAELSQLPMTAPRVVQTAYGDFKATVRVGGKLDPGLAKNSHFDPYHGAGLLVWKNERNYLRLERAVGMIHGHATPYLNFEQRQEGRLILTEGIRIEDHPIHLKLERADGVLRAWRSSDGSRWSAVPGSTAPLIDRVEVGVVAISSSRHRFKAELERFHLDLSSGTEAPTERAEQPIKLVGPPSPK